MPGWRDMDFVLPLLLVVLLIRWVVIWGRLRALEARVGRLESLLERAELPQERAPAVSIPSDTVATGVSEAPMERGLPLRCGHCGRWSPPSAERCDCGYPLRPSFEPVPVESPAPSLVSEEPEPVSEPAVQASAVHTASQWGRQQMTGAEWEAVIGGS